MKDYCFVSKCNRFQLLLPKSIYQEIINECGRAKTYETGGILVGHYSQNMKNAIVTHATNPTEDSKHGKSIFLRGRKGLMSILNSYWIEKKEYYIGEWHYHPRFSPNPSHTDIKQMKQLSSNLKLKCPEPILLIIGQDNESDWLINVSVIVENEIIWLIKNNR